MNMFYKSLLWLGKTGFSLLTFIRSSEGALVRKAAYEIAHNYAKKTETVVDDLVLQRLAESVGESAKGMKASVKRQVQEKVNSMKIGPLKGIDIDLKKGVTLQTDFGNVSYSTKDKSVSYSLGMILK
mgnify:CR=1 FL=1